MKLETIFFSIFIALVMLPGNARASDAVPESRIDAYQIQEIVVTASRLETPKPEVAANITVVTRDDIEKMSVSSAAEVLQYVPGVYVEFNGGLGSVATAVIQGSEVRHVAVYQDGVPLNQLANPMTDLSYIPVDTIDRIEVYKGAASSAWGSSLGGVINIITREPDPEKSFSADLRTSYGEFQTSKSRGTFSGTVDRFSYLLSLTRDESNGFMDHTEYEQNAVYAKVNYGLGTTSRLNFVCSWNEGNNADPLLNYPDFWDDIQRRRTYQRLLFETSPADNLNLILEGRHHRFDNTIDDVYSDHREVYNDYQDEIWGISARMNWDITDINTLNLGFDEDWGRYDWIYYTKEYNTRNWAVYANDTFTMGKFSFNAGVRYDDNEDFGSEISPSVGAVYRISNNDALIRAQAARGFSAPPPSWVHDPQFGNPDLAPEIAKNYQLGGEVKLFRFLRLELNLFRADIKDLIRYNPSTEKYENIDEAVRQGIEGNLTANFDFGLSLSFGGSYVDIKNEQTDEVIEDIPRTLLNASAAYTHKWMNHSITGKYIDHNSTYAETRDEVFIFDYLLKLAPPFPQRYGQPSFFCAVHNIFNTTYLYREVWPQPDRWVEAGVRFEF